MIIIRHLELWQQSQNPQLVLVFPLIENVTECKPDGRMSRVLDVTNFNTLVVEEFLIILPPRENAVKYASKIYQHLQVSFDFYIFLFICFEKFGTQ